jgi:nicotinamidase-related amidase
LINIRFDVNQTKQSLSDKSGLLVIDVQGKLADCVVNAAANLENTIKLVKIAKSIGVSTWYVEHCSDKLGPTTRQLQETLSSSHKLDKHTFSLWDEPAIRDVLRQSALQHFVICGMETHVCVYQSVCDLLEAGFSVSVVSDAVSSRTQANYTTGINAMRERGAEIVSVEMIAFNWLRTPSHPAFRTVMHLIK